MQSKRRGIQGARIEIQACNKKYSSRLQSIESFCIPVTRMQ